MKIILTTYGSRGDLQPMMALALALKSRGHDVLLCAEPEDADWGKTYDCPYFKLGSDLQKNVRHIGSPDLDQFEYSRKKAGTVKEWVSFFRDQVRIQFDQLDGLIKDADLVITGSIVYAARTLAESCNIPYLFIAFCPQALPSAQYPYAHVPNMNMHPLINRVSWWFGCRFENYLLKKVINEKRKASGLAPCKDICRYRLGNPLIVATDPPVGEAASNAGLDLIQPGYFHLEQKGTLDPDLEAFLSAGAPPVYMGFGSMSHIHDPETLRTLAVETARRTGMRIIIGGGRLPDGRLGSDPDGFAVSSVPHNLLFPETAVVIHHGGAGTTAAAARAGVPQIIIPHFFDQYYWAEQVHRQGLGPNPLRRKSLTAEVLAQAVTTCVTDEHIRLRVRDVSGLIGKQNALDVTVDYIERFHSRAVP